MNKLFVMLPCYNEEKDIYPLVCKWINIEKELQQKGFTMMVFCVNDCSTDNTKTIVEKLVEENPGKVFLIDHEVNKGLGGVLKTAFKFFENNGQNGDLCVLMDGDNTHDPIYSLPMIEKIKAGYDCVIASRYCDNSQTQGVSPIRLFMSWGAKQYYSLCLNVKNVKDYTCGYRIYTYDIIKKGFDKFGDALVERKSFACMMEVLYKLHLSGAIFAEVPFELRYDNKEGESKMRILKTVKESLVTALSLRLRTPK